MQFSESELAADGKNSGQGRQHRLSPLNAWALAFGCVIGWGSFVMPGTTFLPAAGPLGTGIAMAIGAAVMLVIGFNFHYMMKHCPGRGGAYSYAKKAFGRDQAFLCAWFLSLSYIALIPQNASALALISRYLLGGALQFGFHYRVAGYDVYLGEILLSEGMLALFGIPFLFRERTVRHMQSLAALGIVLGVGAVLCAGAVKLDLADAAPGFGSDGLSPMLGVVTIVLLAPWAFVGFDTLSLVTEEFRFPVGRSFRIIASSILVGGVVYIALSWLAAVGAPAQYGSWQAYIVGLGNLSGLDALPTFQAARALLGRSGVILLSIAALGAILGGIIGFYWASTRLLSAMAQDGILSERFTKSSVSILFIMGVSMIAPFFGRTALGWIVDMSTVDAVVGFGYTSAAAWRTARTEGDKAVQITGAFGTVISALFGLVLLIPRLVPVSTLSSESYLALALWSILGFAFYWRTLRSQLGADSGKSLWAGAILLILVIFASLFWVQQTGYENSRQVLDNLNAFNTSELEEHGVILSKEERTAAEAYLNVQMSTVNGSLWVSTLVQLALLLAALLLLLKVYQIITAQRREMETQKLQAEERSKAKSALLFHMSHDLRTPMNAVLGFTALARKDKNLSPYVSECLSKIDASGQNLLTLLNDILEMSSMESEAPELEPEATDLVGVIDETQELFQGQMAEKKIRFTVEKERLDNRWALCDRNRLGRILRNLLSNACKFTPEGGAVLLSLRQSGAEGERGRYTLTVRDNGIGMSQEFAERVFDAFEQERTSTVSGLQGTGLGMAITKRLVDLMDGVIRVNTELGKGTEFTIQLSFPFAEPPEREQSRALSEYMEPDFSKKRLLLVEDIEINREIAVMLLEEAGFEVDEAENGQVAVEKIRDALPGTYDAILMDLQMPVMNGFEAARAIRAMEDPTKAGIPIVAVTANTSEEDVQNTRAAGMNGHVAKPLELDRLLQALAKLI